VRVAGLQLDIVWEKPEANYARIRPWLAAAKAAGARLVALPEMFPCGFSMAPERVAEAPDGPTTRFLLEESRTHGLYVAGSVPERVPGLPKPFNTLILAGPDGSLARYRKIHPFTFAGEDKHYGAGEAHVTVTVEGVRLTLFVCYDLRFANEFWATAAATDAYVVVANWPERRRHHWTTLLHARAIENQAYVIGINRVGEGDGLVYKGDSRIVDPWGEALATAAGTETLLLAEVDEDVVRQARESFPVLRDRRG
jgi:predicted amidohydrolase